MRVKNKDNHYVYLLQHKDKELYYIGSRSCNGSIGNDSYMGSSSVMTTKDKENCHKIILARFKTREEAIAYEVELHNKFDVATNSLFWNKAKQTSTKFSFDPTGIKKSKETRKRMSKARQGTRDTKFKEYDVYDYTTNKLVASRVSLYHFSLDNNVDASGLCKTAKGRIKQHKGYYARRSVV